MKNTPATEESPSFASSAAVRSTRRHLRHTSPMTPAGGIVLGHRAFLRTWMRQRACLARLTGVRSGRP